MWGDEIVIDEYDDLIDCRSLKEARVCAKEHNLPLIVKRRYLDAYPFNKKEYERALEKMNAD